MDLSQSIFSDQQTLQFLMKKMKERKIIVFSDTHSMHDEIDIQQFSSAQICIHAGDFTMKCEKQELAKFRKFIEGIPIKHKIVIPGNHDFIFDSDHPKNHFTNDQADQERKLFKNICNFLEFQMIDIEGIKILGISKGPEYFDWKFSFAKTQGLPIIEEYKGKVDILITHWPPYGILDQVHKKQKAGSKGLLQFVKAIKPKIHIFGHIHEKRGFINQFQVQFYNASNATKHYDCIPQPLQIAFLQQCDQQINKS